MRSMRFASVGNLLLQQLPWFSHTNRRKSIQQSVRTQKKSKVEYRFLQPTYSANIYRCKRCVECPICFSTLRIVEDKSKQKEIFYFLCSFCRWTSLHIPKLSSDTANNLLGLKKLGLWNSIWQEKKNWTLFQGNLLELEQQDTQKNYITKLVNQLQKQERDLLKVR